MATNTGDNSTLHNCGVCGQGADMRCSQCKKVFYCSKAHQMEAWPAHKPQCLNQPKPSVLIVSLWKDDALDNMDKAFLKKLRTKADCLEVLSSGAVETALSSTKTYAAILAIDAGIAMPENKRVAQRLVEYARAGGTVIIGLHFSTFVSFQDHEAFWKDTWDLPWRAGSYHRTTFALNPSSTAVQYRDSPKLSQEYSMKALHLAGIAPEAAMYLSTDRSHLESHVFPPSPIMDHTEAPVVFAKYGDGFVGYIGDVNNEDASTYTILAMCGLLSKSIT